MKADLELKKMIPLLLSVIIIVAVAFFIVFSGDGNSNKAKKKVKSTPTPVPATSELKYDSACKGMVTRIDIENSEIGIYDFKFENTMIFSYSGGTHFANKYDGALSAEQLYMGMIVEIKYISEGFKLVSLKEYEDAWEYKKLKNFSYNKSQGVFKINATDFKVTDDVLVVSDNTLYALNDISATDVLNVRGIDKNVWSIEIVKGHGYLTLEGADDLIGGELDINGEKKIITEDMRIEMPEGNYTLNFSKDKLKREKKVYISRFNVTNLDVSDIFDAPKGSSQVSFNISPQKAVLYIDGIQQSYGVPVILEYGTYKIKVVKDGYNTYIGTINVNDAGEQFTINLTTLSSDDEEKEDGDDSEEAGEDESNGEDGGVESNGEDGGEDYSDDESDDEIEETPSTTKEPEKTNTPELTKTPEETSTPEPTKVPDETITLKPTKAPEETSTLKPTKTPEETSTSEPTKAPTGTKAPTVEKPTVEKPTVEVPEPIVPEQVVPEQIVPEKPIV